jgi:excisionase family DNA binding protein
LTRAVRKIDAERRFSIARRTDIMTTEKPDEAKARDMAQERAAREALGKNWEARHVAELLGLAEVTVKRMARQGKLPAIKVGRSWEFPPAKVRAWYSGEPWEPLRRPPPPARRK